MIYKPIAQPLKNLDEITLEVDEIEALRLCDLEELDQTKAGECMGISRGTIQRLLNSGRRKLVEALINSCAIRIQNVIKKS
jgi:predicted DNA-binding protein (UPF0251 family)